jgi:hypothetical protein
MNNITRLFLGAFILLFFSCEQSNTEKAPQSNWDTAYFRKKPSSPTPATDTACDFSQFLNDPQIPQPAKDLFNNTAKYSEEPLSYFQELEKSDSAKRQFYFRVITNSKAIADGAYSEGLGISGKEFIEENTTVFASFFDNKNCFTEKDIETWADIVISEFEIIEEDAKNNSFIDKYNDKLNDNCKTCSEEQKEVIEKFSKALKSKWKASIKSSSLP